MLKNKKILSVILAREGSKGLPGKNIKKLHGKPLLAWPISASCKSKYVDKTILSTDSQLYADIGMSYGALCPFIRPKKLARDTSTSIDALIHAINFLISKNDIYDYVLLLEPTSPMTTHEDIDEALEKIVTNRTGHKSLVSVSNVTSQHPDYCFSIHKKNIMKPYVAKEPVRRQDVEKLFFCDGSLYISEINNLLSTKSFFHKKTMPHIMPEVKSHDIDTELDFFIIEKIIESNKKTKYKKLFDLTNTAKDKI